MPRTVFAPALAAAMLLAATAANARVFEFETNLAGTNEVPPNASPATGFTFVSFDDTLDTLTVDETWSGLIGGNASAAHIHCCIAPGANVLVAVPFIGFPGAASGSYHHVFDLTNTATYNGMFLTMFGGGTAGGGEAALLNGLLAGKAYSNIHNSTFPVGEIRGFFAQVPEPGVWSLMIAGFGLAGAALRRRPGVAAV